MLYLDRYPGQSVIIDVNGETIKVAFNQIKGEKITLGFDAKKSVIINREEIHFAKSQDENRGNR